MSIKFLRSLYKSCRASGSRVLLQWQDFRSIAHPNPVFVLGNQKSGTTAIAALLAAALGEQYSHDMVTRRGWTDIDRIIKGAIPVGDLVRRAPSSFAAGVIKDPHYSFIYPMLLRHFPTAKFVFIVRDPRDNIRSILNRLGIRGDLKELGDADLHTLDRMPPWKLLFESESVGLGVAHYIDTLAQRWNTCAEIASSGQERLVVVRYEDFEGDKLNFVADLTARLGRQVRHDVSDAVDFQFQPRGNRSVDVRQFFGCKNLRRIEVACMKHMRAYSYSPICENKLSGVPHE